MVGDIDGRWVMNESGGEERKMGVADEGSVRIGVQVNVWVALVISRIGSRHRM